MPTCQRDHRVRDLGDGAPILTVGLLRDSCSLHTCAHLCVPWAPTLPVPVPGCCPSCSPRGRIAGLGQFPDLANGNGSLVLGAPWPRSFVPSFRAAGGRSHFLRL